MKKVSTFMLSKILYLLNIATFIAVSQQISPSQSYGTPKQGSISNAWRLPRKGDNFSYFSKTSYYLLKNSYVHHTVYHTVLDTYAELYQLHPANKYILMECGNKKGGKMRFHRTHQNGMSVDFMSPLLKNTTPKYYKGLGFARYLMNFDAQGCKKSNKKVRIDYEALAEHLYYLEKNARRHGLKISKVIFKINLKEQLLATKYGEKLKKLNIYFAMRLPKIVDMAHDDHFHVDFEVL